MEVKPGYKQTEVGGIPEEWEVIPLSKTAKRITRGASPRPIDSPVWFDPRSSVGWVRISDVTRSGRYLLETTQRLSDAGIRSSRPVPSGSLIMSICATVGRPIETLINTCIHDGFVVFDQPTINQSFLYHTLTGLEPKWYKHGQTGSQMNLNTGLINGCLIPLPPDPEQRAIATALSDVDGLLGGLDRLITKKRDLKQATMQELLTGRTRLPGFRGEWEVKRLKTIVQTPVTDGPHLTPQFYEDGIPFLSVNNLVGNRIDLTDLRFISQQDHELFSRKCKPRKDDILLGKAASVGKVAIVELDYEFNIWSPIALIRISSDHVPRFIYYQLQSVDLMGQVILLTNSSSQGNIGMGDIEKLILKLPSHAEQTAIAEVLTEMDGELAVLEQRREKTRALKQAMMQELLTGRTRLV